MPVMNGSERVDRCITGDASLRPWARASAPEGRGTLRNPRRSPGCPQEPAATKYTKQKIMTCLSLDERKTVTEHGSVHKSLLELFTTVVVALLVVVVTTYFGLGAILASDVILYHHLEST
jgi:hypothetical protein